MHFRACSDKDDIWQGAEVAEAHREDAEDDATAFRPSLSEGSSDHGRWAAPMSGRFVSPNSCSWPSFTTQEPRGVGAWPNGSSEKGLIHAADNWTTSGRSAPVRGGTDYDSAAGTGDSSSDRR